MYIYKLQFILDILPTQDHIFIVANIALQLSLLFIPIPSWTFNGCRNTYYLQKGQFEKETEENEDEKPEIEPIDETYKKIFMSLNLPLRLVYEINNERTDAILLGDKEIPYSKGQYKLVVDQMITLETEDKELKHSGSPHHEKKVDISILKKELNNSNTKQVTEVDLAHGSDTSRLSISKSNSRIMNNRQLDPKTLENVK